MLVLGGGDGLAVREILKYPNVSSVTLVDLDPEMTKLFSTQEKLVALNGGSLRSPRVHVVNADAFIWLDQNAEMYDFIVVDFPDPNNYGVGKLYTTAFYRLMAHHLSAERPRGGAEHFAAVRADVVLVHCADAGQRRLQDLAVPCVRAVVRRVGLRARGPARLLAANGAPRGTPLRERRRSPADSSRFPPTCSRWRSRPNQLNNQVLVRYYEQEFEAINR